MRWSTGALTFAVLHPTRADYEAKRPTNSMSCVVLITTGATRLLLTGDVTLADEIAMLTREQELRAEWLAVPHHGSRGSSGAPLLDTLGARFAVAQAGYRNRFRHPDAEVMARYRERKVDFFRTDHAGALQWRVAADGSMTVASLRQSQPRYWHNRPQTQSQLMDPAGTPETGATAPDAIPGPPEPFTGR